MTSQDDSPQPLSTEHRLSQEYISYVRNREELWVSHRYWPRFLLYEQPTATTISPHFVPSHRDIFHVLEIQQLQLFFGQVVGHIQQPVPPLRPLLSGGTSLRTNSSQLFLYLCGTAQLCQTVPKYPIRVMGIPWDTSNVHPTEGRFRIVQFHEPAVVDEDGLPIISLTNNILTCS